MTSYTENNPVHQMANLRRHLTMANVRIVRWKATRAEALAYCKYVNADTAKALRMYNDMLKGNYKLFGIPLKVRYR